MISYLEFVLGVTPSIFLFLVHFQARTKHSRFTKEGKGDEI